MKINTSLDRIDSGSIALPEFQRGYVWNRTQVRKLMRSLYRGYPIGSLLMWETKTEQAEDTGVRGDGNLQAGVVNLLLDGQQRITSLYGIIRGGPPPFFDGDASRFTGLYFNLDTEEFEFYGPIKMKDDPMWIDVTELMQIGVGQMIGRIVVLPQFQPDLQTYINRLNAIGAIKERELHVEMVTGSDKTVDIVVEIFNEVNSGGTKLSKGDLALAKVCAAWPTARDELKQSLQEWERAGYYFKLDWLIRCVTTVSTGQAYFSALADIETSEFQTGLRRTKRYIDTLLNLIAGRLGLDHDRVLGSHYSIPLMVRYLHQRNGHFADNVERDRLLYWFIHTMLWGRYSGSTESTLSKDLTSIQEDYGALDRLIDQLYQDRGDLRVYGRDFEGWSTSDRFYPMLYMMTRVWHAKDWESGIDLTAHLLGKTSSLQVHHIFPKSLLYDYGYSKAEVNAVANFTFLTQNTNLIVSNRDPSEYLAEYASRNPDVIESHWIPLEPELWRLDRYPDFLEARRELLADAANEFLQDLLHGEVPEVDISEPILEREVVHIPGQIESDEEEEILLATCEWVMLMGLAEGELLYQLVNPDTGELLAVLDLAWPNGVQEGRSKPVALLLNEGDSIKEIARRSGFHYFDNIDDFRSYIEHEILELETVGD